MTDTDGDTSNGRVSNNQLILSLQRDVRQLEQTLASLLPQLSLVLDMGKSTEAKLGRLSDQLVVTNRDLALLDVRVKQVEERPIAMQPELRGTIIQNLKEHDDWIVKFREDMHEFRNKLQSEVLKPPLFNPDQCSEIDRMLALIAKRDVTDIMTPSQRQMVAEIEVERTKGSQRSLLRRAGLEQALITFLFGAGGLALLEHFLGFH